MGHTAELPAYPVRTTRARRGTSPADGLPPRGGPENQQRHVSPAHHPVWARVGCLDLLAIQ